MPLLLFSCSVMSESFVTPWTVAHQASLSMGFPRQEYWSGLSFPPLGDFPDPGIEPTSPALVGRFFITEPPGKPFHATNNLLKSCPSKIPKRISKVIKNIITIYLVAKNICKVCQIFPLHLYIWKQFPLHFCN